MEPIAYTYEADIHCPDCAAERFGEEALDAAETEDNEGNPIGAVFSWDEFSGGAWCGDCNEVLVEPDGPDFWQLIETAPKYASAVADLFHWSTNYDARRAPSNLFCDLIGYSADEYGSALYSAEHGDYGLGYVEVGKLAAALTEWADCPGDVVDFVSLLMSAEQ